MDDRERLILLNSVSDIGSLRVERLLEAFGSLKAVYEATREQLQQVEGIGPALAAQIVNGCRDTAVIAREEALAKRHACTIVTRLDDGYPEPLRQISDPPLVLYMKGSWQSEDAMAVAMVGSRQASLYGREIAQRLAADLAVRGVTVVSGLARGIDGVSHRGALQGGGRTLAVLGSGLARIYPTEHAELAKEVVEQGALISEYPMTMEPLPHNFPRRNRLISGLSLGVVIVEAAKCSGALITADCALEQGREVFAVPGRVDTMTAQGTHQLLKQGARLVTCVEDILEELRLRPLEGSVPINASREASQQDDMTDAESQLLGYLDSQHPQELDALAAQTGLPASRCASTLLTLELKRAVKQLPGKRFVAVR